MNTSLRISFLQVERGGFAVLVSELCVGSGEIHVLKGPSGSGKSTVLQALAGFVEVKSGKIFVGEVDISHWVPEKRKMGYVFQQGALFPNMNVVENVAFALRVRGVSKAERNKQASAWLKRVGLQNYELKKVDEISGGEAQRVQFARTLIAGFPVLLLDEPFSSLDVNLKNDLRELLKKLVRESGVACLLVSHDPEDIERLADSYSEIRNGEITKTVKVRSA